jgi:tetratricopeptide (TPR) repeat protein
MRFYVYLLSAAFCAGCATSAPPKATPATATAGKMPAQPPAPPQPESWTLPKLAKGAKLLGNMGKVHRTVTTQSKEAQAFFDQGLALMYGFNHDEAARSFAYAAELDPGCGMCFWGAAYTLGPNYNIPMLPDRAKAAWEAVQFGLKHAPSATDVERALIEALAKRYKGPEYVDPVAMAAFNQAYADAMGEVAKRFPQDLDVQTLYAEALMNLNPWKLWTLDGKPEKGTDVIVATLERVLARDHEHAGANHFYIHAVEASKKPGKAVPSADRLAKLVPGAGHIVHMPAHIYQRVGRYGDAAESNRRAIDVDKKYIETQPPPGYYPFYLGHNYGFLAYAASMQGRAEESLRAAREATKAMPMDIVCGMPGMDFFLSEPLLVMVRFGRWDEILREPKPAAKYQVLTGLWHHAQGMAYAAKGQADQAAAQAQAIRSLSDQVPADMLAGLNPARLLLDLGATLVEARNAEAQKKPDAIGLWERAVQLEDKLAYSEPADWFYPVRHFLGAALLDAGRAKEAEAVYRADLERNPNNGWAHFGIVAALRAQKKPTATAEKAFKTAWQAADIKLTRTAF